MTRASKTLVTSPSVAYFSMEVGIDPGMPTYSGGLGILAGDALRAAADLGVPVVGMTLLHRKGYFRQYLDSNGNQSESPSEWSPEKILSKLSLNLMVYDSKGGYSVMRRIIKKDSDLEIFWLQEMGEIANLSYRLQILLSVRKTFPANVFIDMVNNEKFLEALDIFDSRLRKWASHGEPPSEDMIKAFGLLLAGRPFEDVKEEVVEEAMLRPTNRNRIYEREKELTRRKRTIKRAIYRAKDYLEAAGFQVKHRPPLSPEVEQFRKMLKSSASRLEEGSY